MTALALILSDMGNSVTGSDTSDDYLTASELKLRQIPVAYPFSEKNLRDADMLVYSGANGGKSNIEVEAAQSKGLPNFSLAEFVGKLSEEKKTISVCGCHGKSTTSALIAHMGNQLRLSMSYYIGVPSFMGKPSGRWDSGDFFVVESDEYVADPIADRTPKFLYLAPYAVVCTNIDFDHPDVFKDLDEVEAAFGKFFMNVQQDGFLVVNGDDTRLLQLARNSGKTVYTYGEGEGSDYRISNIEESGTDLSFSVTHNREKLGTFSTKLLGVHNVYNATAAIVLYTVLKYSSSDIQIALQDFTGVSRRIEFHEQIAGSLLYDDYAHHPAEIVASLAALKKRYPRYHVTVIFQPHTYSRTEKLKEEFIESLKQADTAILLPIFGSARESVGRFSVTSDQLVMEAQKKGYTGFEYVTTDAELSFVMSKLHEKYPLQVIVTMGAGDVYNKLAVVKKNLL
jgi:UDP-N-acetylmuramate--alanine ligase